MANNGRKARTAYDGGNNVWGIWKVYDVDTMGREPGLLMMGEQWLGSQV